MVRKSRRGRSKQRGGHGLPPLVPGTYSTHGQPYAKSNYYTISGGKRRRSQRRKGKKGGEGVIATAALPFGLLALQRYYKGSKTAKKGVNKVGRTFRRRL
jgi:hypothetical protein